MKKLIFALVAGVTAMTAAQAQSPAPYVGVGVASSDHSFKIGGSDFDGDGYKPSLKVFGGLDITPMWGVEAGYTDLTKADFNYKIGNDTRSGTTDGKRAYIAGKATMPVNEMFSVYGKLGAGYTKVEGSSPNLRYKESETGVYGAVGGQYNLSKQVALTLEYERYGKSKDFGSKADAITVGARYSF
ncbi:porin family protein [Massilia sp. CCM 9210]|uniref:porin family protein n=1 Tax=Massilia scottii TaxID=3057166 RepID=UPI00279660B3|nr:porin family protein [Massilia sp. CCM 9210]MDQ1815096.1 porin family protein [Massilia sp. CCM 9210]